jgi:hypothetical protein
MSIIPEISLERLIKEIDEINKIRKSLGLTLIEHGIKPCLKCEKDFYSQNFKTNRVCLTCDYNARGRTNG